MAKSTWMAYLLIFFSIVSLFPCIYFVLFIRRSTLSSGVKGEGIGRRGGGEGKGGGEEGGRAGGDRGVCRGRVGGGAGGGGDGGVGGELIFYYPW